MRSSNAELPLCLAMHVPLPADTADTVQSFHTDPRRCTVHSDGGVACILSILSVHLNVSVQGPEPSEARMVCSATQPTGTAHSAVAAS